MNTRHLLPRLLAALSLAGCLSAGTTHAQSWPTKTVRLISPYGPGSTADIMARIIAPKLGGFLGQQVIVDNRPGAGGAIGMEATARAPKDGYTIMLAASGFTVIPNLNPNLPWDPVNDFAPISQVANGPLVIVVAPSLPIKTLSELIAYARARPGQLRYGHAGIGTSQHMAGELFCLAAGVDIMHVPYKGGKESLSDMLGGRLEMSLQGVPAVLPQIRSGGVRAIAVTSLKRSATLPDMPTVAEAGTPEATANVWFGLLAPAGTPAAVVARLNTNVLAVMKSPDVVEGFDKSGAEATTSSPEEFARMIRSDVATWAKVIKQRGIKGE